MANEMLKFFNEHKIEFLKSNVDEPFKYGTRRALERLATTVSDRTSALRNGEDNVADINRTVNRIVTRSKSKGVMSTNNEGSSVDSDSSSHDNSSHDDSSHDDSEQYSDDRLRHQDEAESDDLYKEEGFEQEEEEYEEEEPYEEPIRTRKRKRNTTRGIIIFIDLKLKYLTLCIM